MDKDKRELKKETTEREIYGFIFYPKHLLKHRPLADTCGTTGQTDQLSVEFLGLFWGF